MVKIKILVADDHPAFREGLCRLLQDEEDMEIVAKLASGEEIVALANETMPDVAIIDVAMPRLNGIDAAKRVKEISPATAILMLSAYDDESFILASIRAGATGYLLKDIAIRELVSAIRMVHNGESVFSHKAADSILSRIAAQENEKGTGVRCLGNRELQVLDLVAKGSSNKEIAVGLAISESTVQTHLVNIFRKLGVNSRTEAALLATEKGWLKLITGS